MPYRYRREGWVSPTNIKQRKIRRKFWKNVSLAKENSVLGDLKQYSWSFQLLPEFFKRRSHSKPTNHLPSLFLGKPTPLPPENFIFCLVYLMLYSTAPSGHSRTTSLVSVMSCLSPSLIPGKCVSGTHMNLSISGLKASLFLYPLWLYFKRSSFQYWRKYMIVVNSYFEQHTDGLHLISHHWTTYNLFHNWVNYWSSYILLASPWCIVFPKRKISMTLELPQAVEFFTNAYNRISFLKEFHFALYYFHVCLWLCRGIRSLF